MPNSPFFFASWVFLLGSGAALVLSVKASDMVRSERPARAPKDLRALISEKLHGASRHRRLALVLSAVSVVGATVLFCLEWRTEQAHGSAVGALPTAGASFLGAGLGGFALVGALTAYRDGVAPRAIRVGHAIGRPSTW